MRSATRCKLGRSGRRGDRLQGHSPRQSHGGARGVLGQWRVRARRASEGCGRSHLSATGPSTSSHSVSRPVHSHSMPCHTEVCGRVLDIGARSRAVSSTRLARVDWPLSAQARGHTMSLSSVRSAALFTGSMGIGTSSQPIWRVDNGKVYGNHTYRVSKVVVQAL